MYLFTILSIKPELNRLQVKTSSKSLGYVETGKIKWSAVHGDDFHWDFALFPC